jgi:hypothetical protein
MKLEHLQYANERTNWQNVCSVQCRLCALNEALEVCIALVTNLIEAGALCRSFHLGGKYSDDLWDVERWNGQRLWKPGCGRPAP